MQFREDTRIHPHGTLLHTHIYEMPDGDFMETATIIATRLGYNEKCKAEAALYIRYMQDRLLIARFDAPAVFDILAQLDMPCWEKLTGVAIRVDAGAKKIGHIVRDSWVPYRDA